MSESLRDGLIRALPYGRRYARALTGNQPEGDLLVAQSLRGLTSQPPAEGFTPLLQLYQAISRLYATDETHRSTQGPGLSSTQRQLLLLTTLEEINVETAARIIWPAPRPGRARAGNRTKAAPQRGADLRPDY